MTIILVHQTIYCAHASELASIIFLVLDTFSAQTIETLCLQFCTSKEDEKGEALSTMHFTSHHPDTERFQHRDKTHGKRNKLDYSDSSDDDILIASVPVLCSPAKKLRPSIVKSHAVSDSDSDTELPIPLSERLNQQKRLPRAAKPAEDQHRFVNNDMKKHVRYMYQLSAVKRSKF